MEFISILAITRKSFDLIHRVTREIDFPTNGIGASLVACVGLNIEDPNYKF